MKEIFQFLPIMLFCFLCSCAAREDYEKTDSCPSYDGSMELAQLREEIESLKEDVAKLKAIIGEDSDNHSTGEQSENKFAGLFAEVISLKDRVDEIADGLGEVRSVNGEFKVGELWFSRSGTVISPIKRILYYYHDITGDADAEYIYEYDEYGRQSGVYFKTGNTSPTTSRVSYDGKTVTQLSEATSTNQEDGVTVTLENKIEYEYN